MNFLSAWEPQLRSVLRIVAAFTFSQHGWQKLFGVLGGLNGGKAELLSLMGAAGVLETFGGALLLVGLFTRPAAFVLSGQMAVAYFLAHAPTSVLFPVLNGGEITVLYCFLFLWLAAAGAGPWSLDAVRKAG
jgi:putative oxidoreductase